MIEQDRAQLFWTANRERLARQRMDFDLKCCNPFGKFSRHPREFDAVNEYAFALHLREDWDQWAVNAFINARDLFGGQARFEHMPKPQCDVGIFSGIARRLFQGHLVECELVFTRPTDIFERDAAMIQVQ